ncbi:MAG: AzlD domain-containing protein [Ruminococcaceae bacterium]|nr:AzlD domain-containing protein [Oscillospiraceae bacterium]
MDVLIYVLVMALTTYLIRMLPMTLFRKKIKSRFAKSFFYYIPYAVLAAMTLPAILYSTEGIYSALAGLAVAVVLSFCNCSLIVVSVAACVAAFLVGLF